MIVWNRTKKRDTWGQKRQTNRPESDWIRTPAEHLRVVSDTLWRAAHGQLAHRGANYRRWKADKASGAPDGRGVRRSYLLSGFARCALCGGSIQAVSRQSGGARQFRYACSSYWTRGASVCSNGRMTLLTDTDAALRELLAAEVLRPAVIQPALDRAVEQLRNDQRGSALGARRRDVTLRLALLQRELANLADMAASGGAVPAILTALTAKDAERRALTEESADAAYASPPPSRLTRERYDGSSVNS